MKIANSPEDFFQSQVIQNIKSRRIFLRYTQAHIGKSIGVTQHAYSKIESGKTDLTIKQLIGIAKALDCDSSIFYI